MTREQAINYLICRGITEYRVNEIVRALTYEPTTKNNSSELEKNSKKLEKGITKNDLGVEEVTALAEWTEKLTKASEDAYNKGYADGVKSVNICPHCGEYIGEEE